MEKEKTIKSLLNFGFKTIKNVAICATMSAGKTTFVNALLGRDLLPTRNEATTAKITSVYDDDNSNQVSGFVTKNGMVLDDSNEITTKIIDEWNANPLVERIWLRGNLDNITSQKYICAIHDTPGTNNSGDKTHHDITMQFLESNKMDIIIYVANCGHLETDSEEVLLKELNERVISKQKIPVMVILNKADEIDFEKENLMQKICNYKIFLEDKIGIKNFKLFLLSAKDARLIKMAMKGNSDLFTDTETNEFSFVMERFSEGTDFGNLIGFSEGNACVTVGDKSYDYINLNIALAHTGIMRIEEEIENILSGRK